MASNALRSQVGAKWHASFQRLNGGAPGITGLMEFSKAWTIALRYLHPKNIDDVDNAVADLDLNTVGDAFSTLIARRRLPLLMESFLDEVQRSFHLVEQDIKIYTELYEADEEDPTSHILKLIQRIMEWYKAWAPPTHLGSIIFSSYTLHFQTCLFAALPPAFSRGFKSLCTALLALPEVDPVDYDDDDETDETPEEKMARRKAQVERRHEQEYMRAKRGAAHAAVWDQFDVLGLIDRYENVIASVGYEHIEKHVLANCTGEWRKPLLNRLKGWMADNVVPWMVNVYARDAKTTDDARSMLQGVGSRFDFHMNKVLLDLRTREIFDIIVDYPDSKGALHDINVCLLRVDQRGHLVTALKQANRKRLLHPGAETRIILQQYVSTIKCLREIDPQGVLLFKVADPIRRYLRGRQDTIRCIVANLVGGDDSGDSLLDDSEPIQPLQQPDVDDFMDDKWHPEPIDAGPEFRTNKPSDIISTLVSIYDSQDLFVKELQVLLAQRLLAITKEGIDRVERERRNIEILKIRFGEEALQVCEVMLRDMTDSKRIDHHVQSHMQSVVHPTIISRAFWPSLESSDLVMPGQFQKLSEGYAREFQVFKPDKKLKWLPHLGTVQLDIELEDRTLSIDVPPLEAAFIELFSQKPVWVLDELMPAVGSVARSAAVKALSTWVDLGVLKEDPENTFILLEKKEDFVAREKAFVPDEEELQTTSLEQQHTEQMRMYWKFIQGMLTNLGQLPIDRIQSMLKYAPNYDRTVEQLSGLMEAARKEGLVIAQDGLWRLSGG